MILRDRVEETPIHDAARYHFRTCLRNYRAAFGGDDVVCGVIAGRVECLHCVMFVATVHSSCK